MARASKKPRFQVFISHSSIDTWVALRIAEEIRRCGADSFLDEANVKAGDDFEAKIIDGAKSSDERLVLLTPWAVRRPYILMEIGSFWSDRKRIVGLLHGIAPDVLSSDPSIPVILKRSHLLDLNEIDRYFDELRTRIHKKEGNRG